METASNCEKCNKIATLPQSFTCGHVLCSTCTIRIIFFNHIKDISNQDQIRIQCKCKSGIKELTVINVQELLSFSCNSHLCFEHRREAQKYCPKCENWFCDICIDIHTKINPHHQLADHEIEFAKCSQHQRQLKELHCLDCEESVCQLCTVKGAKHVDHNYLPIEDYAKQLRGRIPTKHFSDMGGYLNRIEQIAVNFKDNLQSTLEKFDQMIQQLEECKVVYKSKMQQTMERANILINLIKLVYLDFKHIDTTLDINLLQDLSSIQYDFGGLELEENEKINKIGEKITELREYNQVLSVQSIVAFWRSFRTWATKLTITGHSSSVFSLIQLKNGKIASGSRDKTIKIWEISENNLKNTITLTGHSNSVWSLVELRDGRIASGSFDNSIKIWEITDRDFMSTVTLTGHTDSVRCLIELKGGHIASGSNDKTIKIWEVKEKESRTLNTVTGHNDFVLSLIQLKDGRMASGSKDNSIKIWEVTENEIINCLTLTGHENSVCVLIQLKDGRLASGACDNLIKIWEVNEKDFQNTMTLTGHSDTIRSLVQLNDGRLFSGSEDKTIKVWEVTKTTFKNTLALPGHGEFVYSLIGLKDGRIASGSDDSTIKIWEDVEY